MNHLLADESHEISSLKRIHYSFKMLSTANFKHIDVGVQHEYKYMYVGFSVPGLDILFDVR